MIPLGLTPSQRDCLLFIKSYAIKNGGVSPSYDEIAAALGLASKSGVHRLVVALEQRGHVRRVVGSARSIVALERAA